MCKYIPLGSVILLKGGTQKVMVVSRGLMVRNNDKDFYFDYAAVPYPEGLISDQLLYFNHENISKVVFEGYSDVDDENVIYNINSFLEENPEIVKGNPKEWK